MEHLNTHQYDELLFNYFEGTLDAAGKSEVNRLRQESSEFAQEYKAWQSTYFVAEEIEYPLAVQLLASGGGAIWLRWAMGLLLFTGTAISLALINASISGVPGWNYSLNNNINENSNRFVAFNDSFEQSQPETASDSRINSHGGSTAAKSVQQSKNLANKHSNVTSPYLQDEKASNQQKDYVEQTDGSGEGEEIREGSTDIIHSNSNDGHSQKLIGGQADKQIAYTGTDAALMEAIAVLKSTSYKHASKRKADVDDALEYVVHNVEHTSVLKRFSEKLKKSFNQPLGLVNLKDPHFALPGFHSVLAVNPSYAGSMNATRITTSVRARWLATDQAGLEGMAGMDGYIKKLRTAIALTVNYNQMLDGRLQLGTAGLIVSPKIKINRNVSLEPSVKYSFGSFRSSGSSLAASGKTELERAVPFSNEILVVPGGEFQMHHDLAAGIILNTRKFYAGASVQRILQPAMKFPYPTWDFAPVQDAKLPLTVNIHAGTDYRFHGNYQVVISPYALLEYRKNYTELWTGAFLRLNKFITAGSVSTKGNVDVMAGMQLGTFRLAYHFDRSEVLTLGKKYYSHELNMRVLLGSRDKGPILKYD